MSAGGPVQWPARLSEGRAGFHRMEGEVRTVYFDVHSDIWTDVTVRRLQGERHVLRNHHLDRLRKGGVAGSIFVIWVDPPYTRDCKRRTEQIMACVRAEIEELTEEDGVCMVCTYDEMVKARAEGKLYIVNGIEGMAAIGTDVSRLDEYYAFGCRHGMLTWNEANQLGAGANSGVTDGLTDAGKRAVRRMQDRGMLVDVSHLNDAGFWDIAKMAVRPFVASHSNARALCDVPRNLTDDQLRAVRDAGGAVGLNAYSGFVSSDCSRQTAEELAHHAAHMIDVMGIDHVGCGFDFFEFLDDLDGSPPAGPEKFALKGLKDSSEIPNLFACFEKMGMSREEMEKIAFRNFQEVYRKAVG